MVPAQDLAVVGARPVDGLPDLLLEAEVPVGLHGVDLHVVDLREDLGRFRLWLIGFLLRCYRERRGKNDGDKHAKREKRASGSVQ